MKLEINSRRKRGKSTNMWKLNMLLTCEWIRKETTSEIREHFKMNKKKATSPNPLDARTVVRGKSVAVKP